MTGLVVADTTLWSNFSHAGNPRLVQQAYPSVASPRAVLDEIFEGQRLGYLIDHDWTWLPVLELSGAEEHATRTVAAQLNRGEAYCLAAAWTREALLLTDDRAARRTARALGIRVSGTLGVLVHLVDSKHLSRTEADQLLARMLEKGYRSPVRSLAELG